MKLQRPPVRYVTVLLISIVLACGFQIRPQAANGKDILSAKVLTVRDGDTIVVQTSDDTRVVRLIGIDCPELGRDGKSAEFMALAAKKFVVDLIEGKDVDLEFDMENEDRYGRWLCYVFNKKGEMVNELLVRRGLALTLTYFPFREKKRFTELEQEAKRGRRGLFRDSSPNVAEYSSAYDVAAEVYSGPARTFIVVYKGMAKPWLKEAELAGEIQRIRRYAKQYPPSLIKRALETDGYIQFRENMTKEKSDGNHAISYREAGAYVGSYVTLEGKIVRTKNTGKVTFLDFDQDWKNNVSVVIFAGDAEKFSLPPEELFAGKIVRVTGKIRLYKGRPEIIVRGPKNIRIIETP